MDGDFTGFEPANAQSNIREFEEAGMVSYNAMVEANTNFLNKLTDSWWSNYAVEFGEEHMGNLYDAQEAIRIMVNNTIVECVGSYNDMAESNGDPKINDEHVTAKPVNFAPNGTNDNFKDFLSVSPTGKVGMKKITVGRLLDKYTEDVYNVIDSLDEIPMTIAFYDPGDEIKTAFKLSVEGLKKTLEEKITEAYSGVNEHINDEMLIEEEGASAARDKFTIPTRTA